MLKTEKPTILTSEKFEVRITKEEIAEVVITEAEHDLRMSLEAIDAANEQATEDEATAKTTLETETEKLKAQLIAKYAKEAKALKGFGMRLDVAIINETHEENILTLKAVGTDIKFSDRVYIGGQIYLPHLDATEETKERNKLVKTYRTKIHQIQEERLRRNLEAAELRKNIAKLPYWQKFVKAQLTRKALSTTEEGRDILTIIGKTLPISSLPASKK